MIKIDNNWREGQRPVIDRLLFCGYGLQMSYVLFFEEVCICLHCQAELEKARVKANGGPAFAGDLSKDATSAGAAWPRLLQRD